MQSRQMREQYVPTSRETCFQILSKLSWYISIARLLLFFLSVLFTAPPFILYKLLYLLSSLVFTVWMNFKLDYAISRSLLGS
jgi:hypothetical protein